MKAVVVLLFAVAYVQCRKTYQPFDKNANLAFINMEGGGVKPGGPAKPAGPANVAPTPKPAPAASVPSAKAPVAPVTKPAAVVTPPAPFPSKPVTPVQIKPLPTPVQIKPVPVNPKPVANPITTPGPGTVKQLVNFYDSQGRASPIRPYSYSQAVKQG